MVRSTAAGANAPRSFSYSARGLLREVVDPSGSHAFAYDGNGRRVAKIEPRGATIQPFETYREIPTGAESLYVANNRLVARRMGANLGDVYWYHPDHLGGTNLMTDAAGAEEPSARSQYLPFGAALPLLTTPNTAVRRSGGFQFTGKELDDDGLYDFGSRYYDPGVGRCLAPDSTVPDPSPRAANRYTYAFNNPLAYVDPTGHDPQSALEKLNAQRTDAQKRKAALYNAYVKSGLLKDPLRVENAARSPDAPVSKAVSDAKALATAATGVTYVSLGAFDIVEFGGLALAQEAYSAANTAALSLSVRLTVAFPRVAALLGLTAWPAAERVGGPEVAGEAERAPATVEQLVEMMNSRPGVSARIATGDEARYLRAVGAEGSHMMMQEGESQILLREGAGRWTAIHEWLHRSLQLQNGGPTPGEDAIIESFLARHQNLFQLGSRVGTP